MSARSHRFGSPKADLSLNPRQPIVLSEGAAFSESGNLCLPVNLPASYVSGSRATLYVEAMGDGETVSSCAGEPFGDSQFGAELITSRFPAPELVLVPSQLSNATVVEHGAAVVNEQTGGNYTFLDYYCSNSTIPALDTCSCHCHGDHGTPISSSSLVAS